MSSDPPFAEMFWGAYLTALHETGSVNTSTPEDEIRQIKEEFMTGLRGERP